MWQISFGIRSGQTNVVRLLFFCRTNHLKLDKANNIPYRLTYEEIDQNLRNQTIWTDLVHYHYYLTLST